MESHVRTLARVQAALGVESQVICVNHAAPDGRDLTWSPFRATGTMHEADGAVRLTRVGRKASLARFDLCPELPTILQGLQRSPVDLLHLHTPNPIMVMALALLRPTQTVVITHHSDIVRQRILRYALGPFEEQVYSRADRILFTSAAYAVGCPALRRYHTRAEVLPLGIDLAPYVDPNAAARAHADALRNRMGSPLWLAVGRLTYYKALHLAIDALASIPGTLLLIGTGPLEAELRRRASQRGVADRIVWRGRVSPDELAGAYQAATALWFPSNARSEAFGLVQVEAMASGCPVINTAIPDSGVAWVSRHEETGLSVSIDNSEALARAAKRLLSEPGLRARLSVAARARACREFDDRLMGRRSLEIYGRVLARRFNGTLFLHPARNGSNGIARSG
jgi:rhamnosyl/mannosyltransferase